MTELTQFHNLAHVFISLIGGILLLAIYFNIRKRFKSQLEEDEGHDRVDRGLLFLSLSMFIWVVSGLWAYIGHNIWGEEHVLYILGISIFSVLNNMFLLLALYYIDNAPVVIYRNVKNARIILSIILAVSVLTLILSVYYTNETVGNFRVIGIPDLLLSAFLSWMLATALYKTFINRGLKLVAFISILVVVLILVSQIPTVYTGFEDEFYSNLIKIVAKTSLISIFLLLATSWVIELANTPVIKEMQIKFMEWSLVRISIPSKNIHNVLVDFGSKTTQYKNLARLAVRRKHGSGKDQTILVGSSGEIKSQTYLSRIIDNLNAILNLVDYERLERKDLFSFVGEGRYKLRVLPEHILIDKEHFAELIQSFDNEAYKAFCDKL